MFEFIDPVQKNIQYVAVYYQYKMYEHELTFGKGRSLDYSILLTENRKAIHYF